MKLKNDLKGLISRKGFRSLVAFAEEMELSYYLLRRLANNEANNLDVDFLVQLCEKLDCKIDDLFYLEK